MTSEVNLSARDRPRRVRRASVNAELLEALAVPPERGRWFRREETRAGGPAVVILSNQLWQSAFGAQEDLVGQSIEIEGVMHQVIGIMPAGFDLMDKHVELWQPLQLAPALRQFRASHFLSVVGRLKNGVAREQAETELTSLMASWGQRTGASGHVFTPGGHVIQMEPVLDEVVGSTRRAFWLLQAGVGLVLLIACANLASLLIVRAEVRRREVAVRDGAWCGSAAAARPVRCRGARAPGAWRCPWPHRRLDGRARADDRVSRESSPRRRHWNRSGGACLHAARLGPHWCGLRSRATAVSIRTRRRFC